MTTSNWTIDSNQSDVLIKTRRSAVAYLASTINKFNGSIAIRNNQVEDASIEFLIDINSKEGKLEQVDIDLNLIDFLDTKKYPPIRFKSISFEKINSEINFLKGYLTINNITKVVEFEAVLLKVETINGVSKALFEITGTINRKDYGLTSVAFNKADKVAVGQKINLAANLEFYSNN